MNVTLDKIKTISYAVKMRCKGYQLLRNPKGTNFNEINMIKYQAKHNKFEDDIFILDRVKTVINDGKKDTVKKEFMSTHFFDTEKKEMTNKKELCYDVFENGENKVSLYRSDLSLEELDNRKPVQWKNIVEKENFRVEQLIKESERNAYMGQTEEPPLLARIITLGKFDKICPVPIPARKPGFLRTLYLNLTNKA